MWAIRRLRYLTIVFLMFFLVYGCAGRTPVPVAEYQYGDDNKSCNHLKSELSQMNVDIDKKNTSVTNSSVKNGVLVGVGLILFWPALFFMDLSDSDRVEFEALQKRYNALTRIAADKNCGIDIKPIEIQPVKIEPPQKYSESY